MFFTTAYITDKGNEKSVNQDSLLIKEAVCGADRILLAAVCDGMGGLSDGELASSSVINILSEWFENELPELICSSDSIMKVRRSADIKLHMINDRINKYGAKNSKPLGTTLTAVLMMASQRKMIICHVGDSRVYRISDTGTSILTYDHSVVARDLRQGKITEEQAAGDPRTNKLTKCIGSGLHDVSYDYMVHDIDTHSVYLLCTDGFRRKVTQDEISHRLAPHRICDEYGAGEALSKLLGLNMSRGETDNISALTILESE